MNFVKFIYIKKQKADKGFCGGIMALILELIDSQYCIYYLQNAKIDSRLQKLVKQCVIAIRCSKYTENTKENVDINNRKQYISQSLSYSEQNMHHCSTKLFHGNDFTCPPA